MAYKKMIKTSILVTLCAFMLTGCSNNSSENTIVSLKQENVSTEEFLKELNFDRVMYKLKYKADMPADIIKETAANLADYLATTEVLYLQGTKENISASSDEINTQYEQLKLSLDEDDNLESALELNGFTDDYIKSSLKKSIIANKYYAELAKSISISEKDVETFYKENKDSLFSNEFADASHILIKTIDNENNPLSEDKKQEAKKKADDILKQLKNGSDFAELAKKYSEDTSKDAGGKLGSFSKGEMVKPFEDATFALDKNQVSDIIETEYGYHIIKLHDKGVKTQNYEEASYQARQLCLESLIKDKMVSLKDDYNVKINESTLNKTIESLENVKIENKKPSEKKTDSKESADKKDTTKEKSDDKSKSE